MEELQFRERERVRERERERERERHALRYNPTQRGNSHSHIYTDIVLAYTGTGSSIQPGHAAFHKIESGRTDFQIPFYGSGSVIGTWKN